MVDHNIACYDIDNEKISKLRLGITNIEEPGIDENMREICQSGKISIGSISNLKKAMSQ